MHILTVIIIDHKIVNYHKIILVDLITLKMWIQIEWTIITSN